MPRETVLRHLLSPLDNGYPELHINLDTIVVHACLALLLIAAIGWYRNTKRQIAGSSLCFVVLGLLFGIDAISLVLNGASMEVLSIYAALGLFVLICCGVALIRMIRDSTKPGAAIKQVVDANER